MLSNALPSRASAPATDFTQADYSSSLDLVEAIDALAATHRSAPLGNVSKKAVLALKRAVDYAPGRSYDSAWRQAYREIGCVVAAAKHMQGICEARAISACASFLAENADLADDYLAGPSSTANACIGKLG